MDDNLTINFDKSRLDNLNQSFFQTVLIPPETLEKFMIVA